MIVRRSNILLFFILSLIIIALSGIPSFAQSLPISTDDAIETFVQEEMKKNLLPGIAVGVIENNEIVYLEGFGGADTERSITPDTPFIIGSMSKAFTALAIMQLVEAGEIKLDAPVINYLPSFGLTNSKLSNKITVRHLLNQTSGISNLIGLLQCTGSGEQTLEEAVKEVNNTEVLTVPGDRFQYSNANFTVLGLLIETVSGKSYGDYIQERIFEPLGMVNSFTSEVDAKSNGLSTGYRRWFGIKVASELPYLQHAIPSGYIISSAEDITRFLQAQLNGGSYGDISILSANGIAQMHKPVAQSGNEYYGMGWVIGTSGEEPVLWHHGSTPNYHSTMLMEPDSKRGVVVLTNVGLFQVWDLGVSRVVAEGITAILKDDTPSVYGLSISNRYIITDIYLTLITVLFFASVYILLKRKNQLTNNPPITILEIARRSILPIAVDVTWPLFILIAFPAITNIPSWSFWLWYQPDLGYWLIILSSLTLCKAILRVRYSYPSIRQSIQQIGKGKFLLTTTTVEILFIALFFTVMPLASGLVTFVLGVVALALFLEIISIPTKLIQRSIPNHN